MTVPTLSERDFQARLVEQAMNYEWIKKGAGQESESNASLAVAENPTEKTVTRGL